MATPKAPPGGFQQGGWYDGQQYWNGTFSAPGVINSQSNQVGAGQAVSNAVISQTNPANVSYIQKQQSNPTYTPSAIPQATVSPAPAQPSVTASTTPTGAGGASVFTPPPIDLVGTYNNLVSSSGITAKDQEIAQKRQQASEAKAKINDNPFLSEATRVGRIAKIDQLANETLSNLQNEVATKRADIQMQLELQTKQFDINSTQAKTNLEQFNTLLSAGALDNASPQDVANITRSTGLSSNIIASAINNKKISGYQTKTESFDDGDNTGFIFYTVDQLGNVINQSKQITGKSIPKAQKFDMASFYNALEGLNSGGSTRVTDNELDTQW